MSRCRNCNLTFAEDSSWQEFCSEECAQHYHFGTNPPPARKPRKNAKSKPREKTPRELFREWMMNPKNARLVRHHTREPQPVIGIWGKRSVNVGTLNKPRIVQMDVNVGGEIVIKPITREDRINIEKFRGRFAFSENAPVCILPSARFYGKIPKCTYEDQYHIPFEDQDEEAESIPFPRPSWF